MDLLWVKQFPISVALGCKFVFIGLAYVIQLLDQESQLNSLHWFESVYRKFSADKQKIRQAVASNPEDVKLRQTLTLSERRINTFSRVSATSILFILLIWKLQEFRLLEYSYSSARLFFDT